jgi:hypothetical protein
MDMTGKYTDDENEYITDAKIVALLQVLEKTNPNIWKDYEYALDEELLQRGYSPGEFPLGYYIKK